MPLSSTDDVSVTPLAAPVSAAPSPLDAAAQDALLDELAGGNAFGAPVDARIDTPISTIFLAGQRAFKAMRTVRLSFVDFSTLERRRRACEEEVSANATAARLYLGVATVRRVDGRLTIAPDATTAPPLEWLVEMRRFDRQLEFDRLLERDALSLAAVETLADRIAEAHVRAPIRPQVDAAERVKRTIFDTSQTLHALAFHSDAPPSLRPLTEDWAKRMARLWTRRAARMNARGRHGRVRRCHGDLHLGNICLFEDQPTPFDAIAFNTALTEIDIAYDAAFVAMDLSARGAPALANAFLNRWLSTTRDYSGLALWPLFVSLRAAIRAMVAALGDDWDAAVSRMRVAYRAARPPEAPRLIAVGGASGAGKTTLARALAPEAAAFAGVGAVHLRSDVARKRMLGLAPETPAPQSAYAQSVSDAVAHRLRKDAGRALRSGVTVVWDATFLRRPDRAVVEAAAAQSTCPLHPLWLEADVDARTTRAAQRLDAAIRDASDAGPDVARAQRPDPIEAPWRALTAVGAPDAVLAQARAALKATSADPAA